MKLLRAVLALALLIASPAPALAQSMTFSTQSSGARVLCQSAVQQVAPADTTDDTLATCTIPANTMGANGQVIIEALYTITNNANNKTPRIKFGGTIIFGQTLTANAQVGARYRVANRNATNSQVTTPTTLSASFGASTGAITPLTIDTTADVPILFTCLKAVAGDSCALESYIVTVNPKI